MSILQIIIIAIGVLIVLSSFDFNSIKQYLTQNKPTPQPQVVTPPVAPVKVEVVNHKDDLVQVVQKWDDLKDTCDQLGLKEAVDKLNEIFPMLIKVDKP